ncbi:uncharacterized protein LOC143963815 [Lithobates pipiens]
MSSSPLILIMLLLWGEPSGTVLPYCVDQPIEMESFVGENLTLPCKFVYPEKKETVSGVNIIWKAYDDKYCGFNTKSEIYNSLTNVSVSKYHGRLLLRGDPLAENVSLILNNVTHNDTNRFCCRVIISFKGKEKKEFQSVDGTSLTVRGEHELKLEQPSFIPAFAGDTVTFLCRFSSKKYIIPPFISCRLWRNTGNSPKCDRLVYSGNCSDSQRENILYFKISNQTLPLHQGWFCWEIQASSGKSDPLTFRKALGTELVVVERTNAFKIIQPQEIVFQKSAIINCSFTMPQYSNILRMEVYWMIGDPREDYVYHPNPDYIHPDYKGKTRLVDGSNLFLQDFHGLNNTIFYCRVMIRRCATISGVFTRTEMTMEEGPGTLLRSENVNGPSEGVTTLPLCLQSIIIVSCSVLKFILLIALFILALVYIKKS